MNKRSGTTIVSLIVGMALSAFLITAILQIFVTTKNNYKLSQNIAEMNDAMCFAVTRMTNMMSYAGHRILYNASMTFPPLNTTFWYTYFSLPGFDGSNSTIFYSLQGDGTSSFTGCIGDPLPMGSVTSSEFIKFSINSSNALVCLSGFQSSTTNGPNNTATLISDLNVRMWVAYGYDNNSLLSTDDGNVSYYYYSESSPYYATNWGHIRSARVALLLRSRDEMLPQSTTKIFSMFGGAKIFTTPNDRYMYRMHIFTVPFSQIPVPNYF